MAKKATKRKKGSFGIGDLVSLQDLQNVELNGQRGRIVRGEKDGRYGVLVEGESKPVAVKVSCLSRPPLQPGDRVSLHGLKTTAMNGQNGRISSKLPDGRYAVFLDRGHSTKSFNLVNLKHEVAKTTKELRDEKGEILGRINSEDNMSADQLSIMRQMMNHFMTQDHERMMFGRVIEKVPDYRSEFFSAYPDLCGGEYEWLNELLRLDYENACTLPHLHEVAFKSEGFSPPLEWILKRLGSNHPLVLSWYEASVPGDVQPDLFGTGYSRVLRHSFSNQQYRAEVLLSGTVHVGVGFVDLGVLLYATMKDGPCEGPLRYVGVDSSAYAVAKSLVLSEILKGDGGWSSDCRVLAVAQVWFSSTWSKDTVEIVDAALSKIYANLDAVQHPAVKRIVSYWVSTPPTSLATARKLIAEATTNLESVAANLKRTRDRLGFIAYFSTRDFALHGDPVCGNKIMLDCPDGTPPLDDDENIFSAIDARSVVSWARDHGVDIVQAAEAIVFEKIKKLLDWVRSDKLTVELICAPIEDVVDEVASMKPWTMSWSNVCDYMSYSEFHRIARQCSVYGDTIHFGYSMNWVQRTQGAFLFDYACSGARSKLIDLANRVVARSYQVLGWDEFFCLPPRTNPLNTSAHYCLEYVHQ